MSRLRDTLIELRSALPAGRNVNDLNDLSDVMYALEDELGYGRQIAAVDEGNAGQLPPDLLKLYGALKYLQVAWDFLDNIAYDGLLSIFFNRSNDEIAALRAGLRDCDQQLSELFEEACRLMLPHSDIAPQAAGERDAKPMFELDPARLDALEQIEERIEEIREQTWARAITLYQAAYS